MRFSRHGWLLYLTLMALVTAAYLAGPLNAGPVFNAIGASACVAILLGVRKHRPDTRWSWYLIAIGQALFVAGDVIAYNYKAFFGKDLPFPSIADPLYLAVYPVTVAGLLLLIRRRNPGRDWASLVDSVIFTIGLAMLSWIFLMAPYAHDKSLHLGTKLVSIAYPLMDILVLGVAVRMAVGSGRRSPAYYMMISGVGALLITDSVYGWIQLHGSYKPGDPLDGGWILYYVLWGAAALHPSMTTVSHTAAARMKLTRSRVLGIAAAALIAPTIEMIKASARGGSDAIVVGCATIVLFGLVVIRMIGLARAQETTAERERTMRQATGALVSASSAIEIFRSAYDGVMMLAGTAARPFVFAVDERDGTKCLVAEDRERGGELKLQIASLPEDVIDRLQRRQSLDLPNGRAELGPLAPAGPVLMVPFLIQGELAGVLALMDASSAPTAVRESVESLAAKVGLALESVSLTEEVLRNQSEMRFSALVQNSSDAIFVLAPDTTVQYVSPSVKQILGYETSALASQRLADYVAEDDRALLQQALAGLLSRSSDVAESLEFRVHHLDGRWLYTECLLTNLLEDATVGGIVVNLRDITERKEFEEQLTYQAFHDPVTNLANRALFRDRVEHALTRRSHRGSPLAVLFLDLDDFKTINDTLGHATGDRLLQQVSERLAGTLRGSDTVARLGGDEFAILLEDFESEAGVSDIVERLMDVVRAPVSIDDREVLVQCSVGIVLASAGDHDQHTVDDLLRNADVAMYQAKGAGGNTYRHFQPEMHASVLEQLELRAELKAAIEDDQLTLAYQPIFHLSTGEISGYEALLRWNHETRGAISPATFIPVAETSGLIVPLGRWVLEHACREAVALQRARPSAQPRTISVNLSARQLQRPEVVDEVRDALWSSGLEPRCLVLEVTESLMIDDVDLAVERLAALRELGVLVAVDDFGTGYSSLNYIRRLPLNILKIDKRFIDSVAGADKESKLTAAIVDLARVLDLRCVAEGVETEEQRDRLKELSCDYAQGFLLARPMSADALQELLRSEAPPLIKAA
ncbi:MAG: EAL domain-containing protein [Solirubrobacterales bacterium]|nr:EAL domain-containing protein [Solirubrobacterales bacterium]